MHKYLFRPHSILVTILILSFIWLLDFIRLNLHFLDPFNYGLKDYEVTDIVFSQLRDEAVDPGDFEDRIILVDVGEPSRIELAQVIKRVSEAGARVIGIDIMLEGRKEPRSDSLLQARIREADNVVLATFLQGYNERENLFEQEVACDTFFSNYATMGYANFVANESRTVRLFSPNEHTRLGRADAFAVAIAEKMDPKAVQALRQRHREVERINYIGGENYFAQYDMETVLDSTIDLSAAMEGKAVLLGFIGEHRLNEPLLDRFFTPLNPKYSGRSLPDMYGVFIHANILSMILDRDYIYEVPSWLSRLLAVFFTYANVIVIHWVYRRFNEAFHGITRVLQLIEFVALFFLIALLFQFFRVKFDFAFGILALVLAYDFVMIYENLIRKNVPFIQRLFPQHKEL